MSLKLRILSLWMPGCMISRELDAVAETTMCALDSLLEKHAPDSIPALKWHELIPKGKIKERRRAMASAQSSRVSALVVAIGMEEAVRVGREAMFAAGERLGQDAKRRLEIGESLDDAIRAARVLYRVLGIGFGVKVGGGGEATICVDRCALAEQYTHEACLILSAADEGVVRGLNPKLSMRFRQRMTDGSRECIAGIVVGGSGRD